MSSTKTKRKPKAPGRPRSQYRYCHYSLMAHPNCTAYIAAQARNGKDARRYAAWLLQFADWADAQAARRKGKGE